MNNPLSNPAVGGLLSLLSGSFPAPDTMRTAQGASEQGFGLLFQTHAEGMNLPAGQPGGQFLPPDAARSLPVLSDEQLAALRALPAEELDSALSELLGQLDLEGEAALQVEDLLKQVILSDLPSDAGTSNTGADDLLKGKESVDFKTRWAGITPPHTEMSLELSEAETLVRQVMEAVVSVSQQIKDAAPTAVAVSPGDGWEGFDSTDYAIVVPEPNRSVTPSEQSAPEVRLEMPLAETALPGMGFFDGAVVRADVGQATHSERVRPESDQTMVQTPNVASLSQDPVPVAPVVSDIARAAAVPAQGAVVVAASPQLLSGQRRDSAGGAGLAAVVAPQGLSEPMPPSGSGQKTEVSGVTRTQEVPPPELLAQRPAEPVKVSTAPVSEQSVSLVGAEGLKATPDEGEKALGRGDNAVARELLQSSVAASAQAVSRGQAAMAPADVAMDMAGKGHIGSHAWRDALGERVMVMAARNGQVAEIQLDPPELGSLKIRLHIGQDQVSVSFSSPHASVRDAVEQSIPRLREMMEEQGLSLGESSVSDQSGDEQRGGDESDMAFAAASAAGDEAGREGEIVQGESIALVDYYA